MIMSTAAATATTTTTTIPSSSSSTISTSTDPISIYEKSGDVSKHLDGVRQQYDTEEKRNFYAQVMGDGTSNIHFGKWDGLSVDAPGAYGQAAEQMTDYMMQIGMQLLLLKDSRRKNGPNQKTKTIPPYREDDDDLDNGGLVYCDLGSGTGGAAIRLLTQHPPKVIASATLLNLCPAQNAQALADAQKAGVADRLSIYTGTYEDIPSKHMPDNTYDLAFSQDAFVHAFDKVKTYVEALRVTKPGGVLVFCDLMRGNGPNADVTEDELATFAATNMVNDWKSPLENIEACQLAGWTEVTFIDLTSDIRCSFQGMGKKVDAMIARGGGGGDDDNGIDRTLLETYSENLHKRVTQVDRGVFTWGVVHGKKPE